jgi:hypothetical protein
MGLADDYAAIIPDLPFKSAVQVHYQESVLYLHDGVPKQRDVPKELGGSGVPLPEQALRPAIRATGTKYRSSRLKSPLFLTF